MNPGQAIILGIVEGITEFLPISSTAHLIVAERIMGIGINGMEKEATDAFTICIQPGAILAILSLYFHRIIQMFKGLFGKDKYGLILFKNIIAGFIPAAIIGFFSQYWIKKYFFGGDEWGLWPIVGAWALGGIAIIIVAWWRNIHHKTSSFGLNLEQLTIYKAFFIGCLQCIAMMPGISRSLVTIVGGIIVGLNLSAAVEFSFLLGLITLSVSTIYDGITHGANMIASFGLTNMTIGLLTATASAMIAVKWMVSYLKNRGIAIFGYYRIIIALLTTILIILKVV